MPAIYNADTWCDTCAEEIRKRIRAEREAAGLEPIDEGDESSYDSDDFPKYMSDNDESDSPCHCASGDDCHEADILPSGAKIGALLSTSLTSYGVEYVRDSIREGGEVAEYWAEQFADYDVAPKLRVSWSDLRAIRDTLADSEKTPSQRIKEAISELVYLMASDD